MINVFSVNLLNWDVHTNDTQLCWKKTNIGRWFIRSGSINLSSKWVSQFQSDIWRLHMQCVKIDSTEAIVKWCAWSHLMLVWRNHESRLDSRRWVYFEIDLHQDRRLFRFSSVINFQRFIQLLLQCVFSMHTVNSLTFFVCCIMKSIECNNLEIQHNLHYG